MLMPTRLVQLIDRPDPIIFDIGANDGEHTQMFVSLFAHALVFSFEPDPRAQARYRARAAGGVLIETAIGAEVGERPFYASHGIPSPDWAAKLPYGWDLSGSIRRPTGHLIVHPWCSFEVTHVPVTTLDAWTQRHCLGTIDFIWADVQGAEGDLIAGGHDTLDRTHYFYTEYSNQALYEGQPTLAQLRLALPRFEVMDVFEHDVLFWNRSWVSD